jgi:hypothetical protein
MELKKSVRFFFRPEWIQNITFNESHNDQTLGEALDDLFRGTDLSYFTLYQHALIIIKDPKQALLRKHSLDAALRQQKRVEPYAIGEPGRLQKERVVITGQVTDAISGYPLPQATIQLSNTPLGTTTNDSGQYAIALEPGVHVLAISFVDYDTKIIDLAVYDDGEINFEMEKMPLHLDEVVVQYSAARELTTTRIGQIQLTMRDIKRAPALLGEVDLIKQLQSLPGVTTVGEAASGFNVRGGSVDQNLILYDGLPVFNSSHVFGFFSAFNSEAIRDVSFYQGGIPAEYGGRVSSVLDIRSKDGDYQRWNGHAGIGLITGNFMVNGPLRKEKTSLIASFRSTYSNWLTRSIRTDYADLRNTSVFFYDGTLKLTHLMENHNKLSFSAYSGKDAFRLKGDTTYQWNNFQISSSLDHQFSTKMSAEFLIGMSMYGYRVMNEDLLTASELSYRITTTTAKAGFNYQRGKRNVNFGWQLLHYRFDPGSLKPASPESNARRFSMDKQFSIEQALYAASEWSLHDQLFVEGGLRLPMFISFGPASVYRYASGSPRETHLVTDTLTFGRGEAIKTYFGLEPRLSARWMINSSASVKVGYNRMYQFLHLVTNATAVTPVDIWQPSGYYFKPQRADQISLGYFKDLRDKKYGFSTELFYKVVENILDFKDGAQLILNDHLETDLLQGRGFSYGIEVHLAKNTGRLSGSMNYTYSRSFRLIAGPTIRESVNRGNQYPANFDQPHIMNVAWKYNLSRRHFFTGNFTFHSGRPVTIPLSAFAWENTAVAYFSERNQYRIPDYHRLDLALVIEGNHKRKKRLEGTWVLSVYNVYARRNPYSVFFKSSGAQSIPKPYQLSIIGTIFPSISYNVKFR